MIRLQKKNKNTPISHIQKPRDWFDEKRLNCLLKHYEHFNGGNILDIGSFGSPLLEMAMPEKLALSIDWMPERLHYESNTFDYVVMGQLLEHLDDPAKYLKEAIRVLKVGGVLAVSVPLNETEAGEVDGTEGHHLWSFSEQDIIDLLKPYGRYEIEILKSQHIPEYKYHFPCVVGFVKKQ